MHETHEQVVAVGPATPATPDGSAGAVAQAVEGQQYITLTQAMKLVPGRPSFNCVWRWARKGVLARNGQRVRLEHVRIGGKLFTTAAWVAQFGTVLAQADVNHFDLKNAPVLRGSPTVTRRSTSATRRPFSPTRTPEQRQAAVERATKALKAVGL